MPGGCHGIANRLSSSPGPTRLWRLTHPDAVRVRPALRSVEAMERLASRRWRVGTVEAVAYRVDVFRLGHDRAVADSATRLRPEVVTTAVMTGSRSPA